MCLLPPGHVSAQVRSPNNLHSHCWVACSPPPPPPDLFMPPLFILTTLLINPRLILISLVWFVWMKGTGQSIWRAWKRPGERSTRRGNRVMLVCSDLSQLLQSVAASTLLLGSLSKPFWAPLLSSFSLLACSLCTLSRVIRTFLMSSRPHRHPQCLHSCCCVAGRVTPVPAPTHQSNRRVNNPVSDFVSLRRRSGRKNPQLSSDISLSIIYSVWSLNYVNHWRGNIQYSILIYRRLQI